MLSIRDFVPKLEAKWIPETSLITCYCNDTPCWYAIRRGDKILINHNDFNGFSKAHILKSVLKTHNTHSLGAVRYSYSLDDSTYKFTIDVPKILKPRPAK